MKRYWLILAGFVIGCTLLLQTGCQKPATTPAGPKATAPPKTVVPELKPKTVKVKPIRRGKKKGPRITFERTSHNFGEIGPGTENKCEFKFKNVGDSLLKISKIQSTCGCTVGKLARKEYKPGESGTLEVTYHAGERPYSIRKQLFVFSNDRARPTVKLTIAAKIVIKVTYEPKNVKLLLKGDKASLPEIKLTSTDGKPFAIKSFRPTTSGITGVYDSSVKATSHIIRLNVDTNRLRRHLKGYINIKLTHPDCKTLTIPFEVLPKFKITPSSIIVFNAEPGKPINKAVWLLNNYGEKFEIASASSEKNIIKIVSQQKVGNRYKFELQVIPPPKKNKVRFTDVLYISTKSGERLRVHCNGFYAKELKKTSSR